MQLQALNAPSSELSSLPPAAPSCCPVARTAAQQVASLLRQMGSSSTWASMRRYCLLLLLPWPTSEERSFGTARGTRQTEQVQSIWPATKRSKRVYTPPPFPPQIALPGTTALWVQITCLMLMLVIEMQKYLEICMGSTRHAPK